MKYIVTCGVCCYMGQRHEQKERNRKKLETMDIRLVKGQGDKLSSIMWNTEGETINYIYNNKK